MQLNPLLWVEADEVDKSRQNGNCYGGVQIKWEFADQMRTVNVGRIGKVGRNPMYIDSDLFDNNYIHFYNNPSCLNVTFGGREVCNNQFL